MKSCSMCKLNKPLSDFHRNKAFKTGYSYNCKTCINQYRKQDKTKKEYDRQYRLKYREELNKQLKAYNFKKKKEVLQYYSNSLEPVCNCCNETNIHFLTIDHINNDGYKHRKEEPSSKNIYYWLSKNKYPKGFQVLCMNCNWGKSIHKICPHKLDNIKYLETTN